MTDAQLKGIRNTILRSAALMPRGVTADNLQSVLEAMLIKLPAEGENSLDAQLLYLERAKLLERIKQRHTASLEVWAITAEGDDYLRSL